MEKRGSIAIRLGKIFSELKKLEVISKWSYRTYKNHFKGILFENLEKRMNEKYLLIGIKKIGVDN